MKLKSKFNLRLIEDIVFQYLKNTEPQNIPVIKTNKTFVDTRFAIKKYINNFTKNDNCDKSPHKINQHKINFFKLPQKGLIEEEDFP